MTADVLALDGLALVTLHGFIDRQDVMWSIGTVDDVNPLLGRRHYLGPIKSGGARLAITGQRDGSVVACQLWRSPTSRRLPSDGTWLELSRWCLTPDAGEFAGSRMHKFAVRLIREVAPDAGVLVSYSDPSHGHTGALYRACNWEWAPTWHRLRPPPTGQGSWVSGVQQAVKDRWVFRLHKRAEMWSHLKIDDPGAIRRWRAEHPAAEDAWARAHPQLGVGA